MNFRTLLLLSVSGLVVASAAGCGDSTETTTSNGGNGGTGGTGAAGGNGGTGGTGGTEQTPPPKLGPQIDRFGRPAINTAVNHTFDSNPEQKDAAKNEWNENNDPSSWVSYKTEIAANLAILDSLDTVCGNQLLAGGTPVAGRYDALAGVLADDRLYINADGTKCSVYLGVEANALGVVNGDCGGRTLTYDVIDASYTVLASGALDGSIGDKIPVSNAAGGEIFPYLIAPN